MTKDVQAAAVSLHLEVSELLDAGRVREASKRLRAVDGMVNKREVSRETRVWLLNVEARIEMEIGRPIARDHLKSALHLSRRSEDPILIGVTLLNLGAEASLTGEPRAAARYWLRALEHFGKHKDYGRYSQALMNLLSLLIDMRRLESAEEILGSLLPMLRGARDPWGRFGVYLSLGQLRAAQGDHASAAVAFRAALAAAKRTGEEPRIATALQNLGSSYLDQGWIKRALSTYRRALQSPAATSPTRLRAILLRSLALARFRDKDVEGAESALAESRHIAARVQDEEIHAGGTSDLGALRIAQRKWAAARHYLTAALQTYKRLKRPHDTARALSNLAALEQARHHLPEAALLLARAADSLGPKSGDRQRLLEQAGDLWLSADRADQASALYRRAIGETSGSDRHSIAWNFLMSAAKLAHGPDPNAALPFFSAAIERYQRLREPQLRFHALNDRALCFVSLDDLDRGADDLRRAIAIGRRHTDRAMLAQGYLNLGEVIRRQGKPMRAAAALRRSIAAARGLGDSGEEAAAMGNLGLALLQAQQIDKAQRSFLRARELAQSVELESTVALADGGLGGVAMHRGEYPAALRHYSAAIATERRLHLQPQLAESTAAMCEVLAAFPSANRRFERRFQQLVDMCQQNGLERLGAKGALRSARWYLHRGDLQLAANVLAVALALTAMEKVAAPEDHLSRAVLEAAFYWNIHVPDRESQFVPTMITALNKVHRGLGKTFQPLLEAATTHAASMPTRDARRDWANRVARVRTSEGRQASNIDA